jgi:hypothetical protein
LHQHQFAFQSLGVSGIAWLNSNKTLQDINFDPITNSLVLYPLREVYKRYGQLGFVPEKTGWLYKSSGSDLDTLKKREKRWFVLTQLFLIYFHSDTVRNGLFVGVFSNRYLAVGVLLGCCSLQSHSLRLLRYEEKKGRQGPPDHHVATNVKVPSAC